MHDVGNSWMKLITFFRRNSTFGETKATPYNVPDLTGDEYRPGGVEGFGEDVIENMSPEEKKMFDVDEPEQLELDLGVKSKFDENARYSEVYVSFSFFRELTTHQFNMFIDAILDAVEDESWPDFVMSGSIRSGTDRELCPEAYDEGEESNSTEEKEVQ